MTAAGWALFAWTLVGAVIVGGLVAWTAWHAGYVTGAAPRWDDDVESFAVDDEGEGDWW